MGGKTYKRVVYWLLKLLLRGDMPLPLVVKAKHTILKTKEESYHALEMREEKSVSKQK